MEIDCGQTLRSNLRNLRKTGKILKGKVVTYCSKFDNSPVSFVRHFECLDPGNEVKDWKKDYNIKVVHIEFILNYENVYSYDP